MGRKKRPISNVQTPDISVTHIDISRRGRRKERKRADSQIEVGLTSNPTSTIPNHIDTEVPNIFDYPDPEEECISDYAVDESSDFFYSDGPDLYNGLEPPLLVPNPHDSDEESDIAHSEGNAGSEGGLDSPASEEFFHQLSTKDKRKRLRVRPSHILS
jgi:hypothetical protein